MRAFPAALERLTEQFARLPGIGMKSAQRLAFYVLSLPKDAAQKVQVTLESRQPLIAPLEKGQEVGILKLSIDDKPIGDYPVLALNDVPVAGFFGRLWDAIVMFFKNL